MKLIYKGFTLIELMVVVSIIAILASIAIPAYTHHVKKAKFTELVTAVSSIKAAVEVAVQLGEIKSLQDIAAGKHGIPKDVIRNQTQAFPYRYIQSITTRNGMVEVTGTDEVDKETYILQLVSLKAPVIWQVKGTCIDKGLC